MLTVKLILTG